MKNADMPAMPVTELRDADLDVNGFTKREEMAARMAAAMFQSGDIEIASLMESQAIRDSFSDTAAIIADSLLAALERR